MAMTKKDFTLVAKAFRTQRHNVFCSSQISCRIIDESIESMAAHFALMYPNFNKDTFLEAAGFGEDIDN